MIRFFDVVFSLIGLILLSPIFLCLAVWIKLDSSGDVFYKQVRVGKHGKDLQLLKFRSMFFGSDKKGLITIGDRDPRVTKSGYFIRKYKLDELPQLINVIKGDMSIVGPRPEVRKYVNLYNHKQRKVLEIKPGITDYASIIFSNENEILASSLYPEKTYIEQIMPRKIRLNFIFLNNRNLCNYFRIIILTLRKIFIE